MKTIYADFKQVCIDNFNSVEVGSSVYNFYRNHIVFKPAEKANYDKDLKKARIAHVKNLLSEFNAESIVDVINYFIDKANKGEIVELASVYFYACVRNNYLESNKPKLKSEVDKNIKKEKKIELTRVAVTAQLVKPEIIKPLFKTLNINDDITDQFLYKCPACNNKIPGRLDKCSGCNSILDYSSISYEEYVK